MKKALVCMGIGAAVMYLFDPKQGEQRRTCLYNKLSGQMPKTVDAITAKADALTAKAHDLTVEVDTKAAEAITTLAPATEPPAPVDAAPVSEWMDPA